jgi:hypothetical protein
MRTSLPGNTRIGIRSAALAGLAIAIATAFGCRTKPDIPEEFMARSPRLGGHVGPAVDADVTGTARFVEPLVEAFDVAAAMSIAEFADGFYRAPASEGYEQTIERVLADLSGAGFGADEGFDLRVVSNGMAQPAWTPRSASIFAVKGGETTRQRILGFDAPGDVDRAMLPIGAPSCDITGSAVFEMDGVTAGSILVTDKSIRSVEQEAVEKGAVAVVSEFLLPYCVDPTGRDRHYDAIYQGAVRPGATLPSFYVSPRTAQTMRIEAGVGTRFQLVADVAEEVKELRTVFATIRGAELPDEVVYVFGQADGAGANDNAAGMAGIVELARTVKRMIESGSIGRPRRSVSFVFGQESGAGKVALDDGEGEPIAAIVADMISASYEATGAVCLMERGWDPGALITLPPDSHTPWGAGEVVEEDIVPNGLAIVMRQALVDVGTVTREDGKPPWSTREHPWEGGADHDAFLFERVAAVLMWHFTDFAYQTSLDRMENVDPEELHRSCVAIGAAALAVADARPIDLERHLDSLNLEMRLRLDAVANANAGVGLEELWKDWFTGARFWLKALTAGEPLPEPEGLRELDAFVDGGPDEG